MVVDTDVLIWYMRGDPRAADALEEAGEFKISVVTYMELEQYSHSHGMRFADALVAATAVAQGARLLTGNVKHYRHVPDLEVERFKPSA